MVIYALYYNFLLREQNIIEQNFSKFVPTFLVNIHRIEWIINQSLWVFTEFDKCLTIFDQLLTKFLRKPILI